MTNLIDYNPEGQFSVAEVQKQYRELCKQFQVRSPRRMVPSWHTRGEKKWIYSIMDEVELGVKAGDLACAELAVRYIEDEGRYPFSLAIRLNLARYLRKIDLTEGQKERLRRRFIKMLTSGKFGREGREYSRLFIVIGAESHRQTFVELSKSPKKYIARAAQYLLMRMHQIEREKELNCG